jgi:hypothetical protein
MLRELGVVHDVALEDARVHEVSKRIQVRATQEPSVERVQLLQHRDRIEKWLTANKPMRLTKVHVLRKIPPRLRANMSWILVRLSEGYEPRRRGSTPVC